MSSSTSGLQEPAEIAPRPFRPAPLCAHSCHTLIHGDQMEQLAAVARATEARGDLELARQQWLAVLPLLPADSKQAEWIRGHVDDLQKTAYEAHRPERSERENQMGQAAGTA